jgi:hypothetical protein
VRTIKTLRDAGCPMQTLRRAQSVLEDAWSESLGEAVLYWDGLDVLRIGEFGEIQSTLRHPGQGVLHLVAIPVGRWQSELAESAETIDLDHLQRLQAKRNSRAATPWRSATA